ncbi:hypothetical protein C3730_25615, partial [Salmonella enterica]
TGPVVIITILSDPIIATVVDSAQGDERPVPIQLRMAEIERVTATGPVVIITILSDPIIATVVDSAQGDERPVPIQL